MAASRFKKAPNRLHVAQSGNLGVYSGRSLLLHDRETRVLFSVAAEVGVCDYWSSFFSQTMGGGRCENSVTLYDRRSCDNKTIELNEKLKFSELDMDWIHPWNKLGRS